MEAYTVQKFYNDVIIKSWTYDRMTETEKRLLEMTFKNARSSAKTKAGASAVANKIYREFLGCLGYKPEGWRETEKTPFKVIY